MSAIYRFGFEHGQVPNGVSIGTNQSGFYATGVPNIFTDFYSYFNNSGSFPAGNYTIKYVTGAWAGSPGFWASYGNYSILINSGNGDLTWIQPLNNGPQIWGTWATEAQAQADGQTNLVEVSFYHSGGPIGMRNLDSPKDDNVAGNPVPTFNLLGDNFNSSSYYWMGRKGNCSLYGKWPNVQCVTPSLDKIFGSFTVMSYDHNLSDTRHDVAKSFVEFGPFQLKLNGSGSMAIFISGNNVAQLSGLEINRGVWYPIHFGIERSGVQFRFNYNKLDYTGITRFTPQSSVKIGGMGGTGLLEDIAINSISGTLDTGVPEIIKCLPTYSTGIISNNWNYFTGVVSTGINVANPNISVRDVSYCPYNNRFYLSSTVGTGRFPLYIDVATNTFNNWFAPIIPLTAPQEARIERVVYCPSRNSIFCSTGHSASSPSNSTMIELDLDGNIINNNVHRFSNNSPTATFRILEPAFYHAKTNRIFYYPGNKSTSLSSFFYFNCNDLSIGTLSMPAIPIVNTDNEFNFHVILDQFYDNIFYNTSSNQLFFRSVVNSFSGILQLNLSQITFDRPEIGIMGDIGSGYIGSIFGNNNVANRRTLAFFNLENPTGHNLVSGKIDKFTNSYFSYSKVSKNIILGGSSLPLMFMNILNTGDVNNILHPTIADNNRYHKNTITNYCPYNNCTYLFEENGFLYILSHHERNAINRISIGSNLIMNNDNAYIKSRTVNSDIEEKIIKNHNTFEFEGYNVYSIVNKSGAANPRANVGVKSDVDGISIRKQSLINSETEFKFSSLYNGTGKYTLTESNQQNPYIKYTK